METLVALLKTLGDPTRLKLLKLIQREELCVCELVDVLQISQPAVSQHLARLKAAGLVRERRAGMWTYYKAEPEQAQRIVDGVSRFLATDMADLPGMAAESERRKLLNRAQCCVTEPVTTDEPAPNQTAAARAQAPER